MQIPGFRPGKIPESVLVGFVGEQNVKKATVESILKRTLPHAMASVFFIMESSFLILSEKFEIYKLVMESYCLGDWKGFERLSPHCD